MDGVPALAVQLALGGAETYAGNIYNKYLNKWRFVRRDGELMALNEGNTENEMTAIIEDLDGKTKEEIIRHLEDDILPQQIRGWIYGSTAIPTDFFLRDEDQSEKKMKCQIQVGKMITAPLHMSGAAFQSNGIGP